MDLPSLDPTSAMSAVWAPASSVRSSKLERVRERELSPPDRRFGQDGAADVDGDEALAGERQQRPAAPPQAAPNRGNAAPVGVLPGARRLEEPRRPAFVKMVENADAVARRDQG